MSLFTLDLTAEEADRYHKLVSSPDYLVKKRLHKNPGLADINAEDKRKSVLEFIKEKDQVTFPEIREAFPNFTESNTRTIVGYLRKSKKIRPIRRGIYSPCKDACKSDRTN